MRAQFIDLALSHSLGFAVASFESLFPRAVIELWIAQAQKIIDASKP